MAAALFSPECLGHLSSCRPPWCSAYGFIAQRSAAQNVLPNPPYILKHFNAAPPHYISMTLMKTR
ncbi:hypothetical protein E2C01_042850 [Portunus trituberculatus]|uniref:Uncharacterized protein n=1 Tax=Portunus trituberculatus TaxID=210409 RepID=A0A5B7FMV0_PORTR|nr:hypothetical protein [Portunus trituberculatus]